MVKASQVIRGHNIYHNAYEYLCRNNYKFIVLRHTSEQAAALSGTYYFYLAHIILVLCLLKKLGSLPQGGTCLAFLANDEVPSYN